MRETFQNSIVNNTKSLYKEIGIVPNNQMDLITSIQLPQYSLPKGKDSVEGIILLSRTAYGIQIQFVLALLATATGKVAMFLLAFIFFALLINLSKPN